MIEATVFDKIGGHYGLEVIRAPELGGIVKRVVQNCEQAKGWLGMNLKGIRNEAYFLTVLDGCGYTPKLIERGTNYIIEEDLDDSQPCISHQKLRRNLCGLLYRLWEHRVRHIDLTWPNVIVRNDWPYAIDFQQSRHYTEPFRDQERYPTDSYTVWTWMTRMKDKNGIADESRIVRRWGSVIHALGQANCRVTTLEGKTFLDLGCFQGDHVAMARCEGMDAEGVDFGGFRTGEDSIDIARRLWRGMGCKFTKTDIFDLPEVYFNRDIVTMFSTWPYLVKTKGFLDAKRVLRQVIDESKVFFFETQLYGDGPGPHFLKSDDDVKGLLIACGASDIKALSKFQVYGRPASRTVWEVRKS